jgi:hypothetical protein
MLNRNIILSCCGLLALPLTSAWARPATPNPEAPPVTAVFSGTYFSNIAASSAALAAARGLKRADILYAPALDLNLSKPMGGLSLFLLGQAGYDFHQRNSILDGARLSLQAGADARMEGCTATPSASYSRFQSNLADLSVVATKNTAELVSGELDVTCSQFGRLVPSGSFTQTWSDNTALPYKPSDYRSTAGSGSLQYNAGSIGNFSLVGQYVETLYPHRAIAGTVGLQSDGYDNYSVGVHYERPIGGSLEFAGSLSQAWISYRGIGNNFSGLTYSASLTYHAGPRLNFNVLASRQTLPTNYLNAAYSVAESYSAGADYRISTRLSATIGAIQTHSNYSGAALVNGLDLTAQTYRSFYGSLGYTLSPTFTVSLSAGQDQRHADVIGYSYVGAHVGLSLSKSF